MRAGFSVLPMLTGLLVLVLQVAPASAQFSKRSRGPGGGFDPAMMFEKMAQGKPYLQISEMRFSSMRDSFAEWAQKQGLKDDRLTREQFLAAWPIVSEAMKSRYSGGGPRGGPRPSTDSPSTPSSSPGTTPPPGSGTDVWKEWAEADFKRRDTNNDGRLNTDEMGQTLRNDLAHWDTNKDGLIDLAEYIPYFRARGDQGKGVQLPPIAVIIEEDLDQRPVVFRAGKLPKELPSWFQELDKDNDGQVSLYEWRKARKPLNEFKAQDRNSDGLLTAEEVLRHEALVKASTTQSPGQQIAVIGGDSPGMQGFPGGGRPGGKRGFKKGGPR